MVNGQSDMSFRNLKGMIQDIWQYITIELLTLHDVGFISATTFATFRSYLSFNLLTPQELAPFLFGPPALMSFLGCLVFWVPVSQGSRSSHTEWWWNGGTCIGFWMVFYGPHKVCLLKKLNPQLDVFCFPGNAGEDLVAQYPARLRMFSLFGYLWGGERLYRISSCNLFSFLAAFFLHRLLYL